MSAGESPPEWLSLDPDEAVEWIGRPAIETLYGTIATGLVLTPVVIGLLILLGVPFTYLRIQHTDYVVTSKSLYLKRGIFSRNIETVDLDRIQNTEFSQSFWGRQFGYGDIAISTAGSSGAEITFSGIGDATTVRDRITELQAARTGRTDDGTAGRAGREATEATATLEELVREVRATREAFERIEDHLVAAGEPSRSERGEPSGAEQPSGPDGPATDADSGHNRDTRE